MATYITNSNGKEKSNRKNSGFDRFFISDPGKFLAGDITKAVPSVNILEEKNQYIFEMAVPGLKKDAIRVEVSGDELTVSYGEGYGEMEVKKNGGNGSHNSDMSNALEVEQNFSRREYSFENFSRTFTVPENADTNKLTAGYEQGILELIIPKKTDSKANKNQRINIK
jgi:HSP20 family protein